MSQKRESSSVFGSALSAASVGFERLLVGLTILAPVVALGFLLWASDRGFDITDESSYLLSAKFPSSVLAAASSAYIYLGFLFKAVGGGLVAFRIAGYLVLCCSALFLWTGLRNLSGTLGYTELSAYKNVYAAAAIIAGALLYYFWFLPTPSYNLANSVSVNFYAGLMLWEISERDKESLRLKVILFLVGVALGICSFIKFPTAGALLLLTIATVLVEEKISRRRVLVFFSCLTAGIAVWLSIHFVFIQGFSEWSNTMRRGVEYARALDPNYSLRSEITRPFKDIYLFASAALRAFWKVYALIGAITATFLALRVRLRLSLNWVALPSLGATFLMGLKCYQERWYEGGVDYFGRTTTIFLGFIFIVAAFAALVFFLDRRRQPDNQRIGIVGFALALIILFSVPFAGAVGTNTRLYENMVFYMAPWFALLWLMMIPTVSASSTELPRCFLLFVVSTISAAMIVTGCLRQPYRLDAGVYEQNRRTSIGNPADNILLDVAASKFFGDLKQAVVKCDIPTNPAVLGFYNMPGVVYALGGHSPSLPWYNGGYSGTASAVDLALSWADAQSLRGALLIIAGNEPLPSQIAERLSFPSSYENCTDLSDPYDNNQPLHFWRPKAGVLSQGN